MSNMSTDEKNASGWAFEGVAGDLHRHLGRGSDFPLGDAPHAWVKLRVQHSGSGETLAYVADDSDIDGGDGYPITNNTPIVICRTPEQRPVAHDAVESTNSDWVEMTVSELSKRLPEGDQRRDICVMAEMSVRVNLKGLGTLHSDDTGLLNSDETVFIRRSDLPPEEPAAEDPPPEVDVLSRIEELRSKPGIAPEIADILADILKASRA